MFNIILGHNESRWAAQEWILFHDDNNNRLRYWSIRRDGFTAIHDVAREATSCQAIATDGRFFFVNDATSQLFNQLAWNGSGFTEHLSADPGALVIQGSSELYCIPNNPGFVIAGRAGGNGINVWSYQSAPTYSYGTAVETVPAAVVQINYLDFRVGNQMGARGYGNTVVATSQNAGNRIDALTVSGTTVTSHSNLTVTNMNGKTPGGDRDTGLIAMLGSNAATIYLCQMDMATRALSHIGNGTITGTTVFCATCQKGFVITYENTGKIRSYSRSGSTLTQVSVIDMGGTPGAGSFSVSPYTNYIYLISSTSGHSRVLELADDGTLTSLFTLTGVVYHGGGTRERPIVFLPNPLPVV